MDKTQLNNTIETSFHNKKNNIELGTSFAQKRSITAIKEQKEILEGTLNEYLELFEKNLQKFQVKQIDEDNYKYDELIIERIEAFNTYKNKFLQALLTLGIYGFSDENTLAIHRFFESSIHYLNQDENHSLIANEWDFDIFNFIIHELFLNTIAVFLKFEKFEPVSYLLNQKYYLTQNSTYPKALESFTIFNNHLYSLEHYNKRLTLNRLSLRGDLLKERSRNSGLDFRYIMQADFICFINAELNEKDTSYWGPHTLLFTSDNALEIFARAESKKYFDKMKCVLNIESVDQLKSIIKKLKEKGIRFSSQGMKSFNPTVLTGIEKLASEK